MITIKWINEKPITHSHSVLITVQSSTIHEKQIALLWVTYVIRWKLWCNSTVWWYGSENHGAILLESKDVEVLFYNMRISVQIFLTAQESGCNFVLQNLRISLEFHFTIQECMVQFCSKIQESQWNFALKSTNHIGILFATHRIMVRFCFISQGIVI